MKTIRSISSDPAARRVPTARDEAAAWEDLCEALRDYSAAVSLFEQLTVTWLADREAAAPSLGSTAPARLDVSEATCARARARCVEALARLDALGLAIEPVDRPGDRVGGRIIPFPIDRVAAPAVPSAQPAGRPLRPRPTARPRLTAVQPPG